MYEEVLKRVAQVQEQSMSNNDTDINDHKLEATD